MKVTKRISISEACITEMEQKVNESWEQFKYPEKLNDKFFTEIQLKDSITFSILLSVLAVVNHCIIWKLYLKQEIVKKKKRRQCLLCGGVSSYKMNFTMPVPQNLKY